MINKLKYIFLFIICFTMIGGALVSAQTDKVLVSGKHALKQSDVDTMIEFYEWAFEAKFSPEQRAMFQRNTIAEFRGNPAEGRKTVDDIVTTFPKIVAATADLQQKTREGFLAEFMTTARQQTDENSQMLVAIYDGRHSGGGDTADENTVGDEDGQVENVGNVSALAGKWVWGRSGSMTTTTSGVYLGGNGSRHVYTFTANGAVEYSGIMNVMTGGCNMQIFRTTKGKATLSGNTLTIKWGPASFSRDDSCSPSKNYKKTMPAETEVFQVILKTDLGQKQLCLTSTDETCYSRSN